MKKLYFVRHAESEGNVGILRQGHSTPLTERGNEQAFLVAERFKNIEIDRIISSPQIRAKSTAEAIQKVTNKPLDFSDLLIERKRPSIFEGKPKDIPEAVTADKEMKERFHETDWRYSDEENFSDLKKRALKFLEYVDTLPEENILLVTHGVFL